MESSTTHPTPLPAAYPIRCEVHAARLLTGGAILLALGAIALCWPLLAMSAGIAYGDDALWSLVTRSVSDLNR
jgi:hypothetical protein